MADGASEIRFSGVGGKSIVRAGKLRGCAAALHDGKHAVVTQSYGPEARGGASRTDVVIDDNPVDYPFVTRADVFAAFFQEAYEKFRGAVKDDGLVIIDTGLVTPRDGDRVCGLPATHMAEELGSRMVTNVIMLGYLVGRSGVVSRASLEEAIRTTVKKKVVDLDLQALEAGFSQAAAEAPQARAEDA